ncbi:MAG: hypothetical protein QOC74_4835 [Pseudonocardiales bacterium]|nr:hypothetical protein [Pseudonocardiales bacterium]
MSPPQSLLAGVRVLDVGHLVAGPMTASVLGDFGADVIKIERPGLGDPLRWNHRQHDVGLFYKVQARNKRCITLNLKSDRGRGIFHELVRGADVVVENFRPGVMERLGNDWEMLRALNPRLVFCRISGWGQDGPHAARPSFGRIAEAFSGFSHLTGAADGPPMHSTMALGDSVAAMWAANAVLMALYWRDAQGGERGQVIDMGLYEPLYRQIEQQILVADQQSEPLHRLGNQNSGSPAMGCYPTADGRYFSFSANTARSITALMRAVGLADEPRFADFEACLKHHEELHAHLRAWFAARSAASLEEDFVAAGAPGTIVMSAGDLLVHPQVLARGMVLTLDDEDLGEIRMQNVVPRFSLTPGKVRHAGQRMGQANSEVYAELGIDADELAELEHQGVV